MKTKAGPGLELVDVPEPECGDRDVKVRVLRAGLCGTDLHLQAWDDWAASTVRAPMTIGHEFFGEVVEVGADVEHVAVGDRVSGEGHIVCGVCRNCRAGRRQLCIHTIGVGVNRDGAFADHVVIPATNAWVQPPDLEPDLGALFDESIDGDARDHEPAAEHHRWDLAASNALVGRRARDAEELGDLGHGVGETLHVDQVLPVRCGALSVDAAWKGSTFQ